jgi:hypothetical protein
MDYTQRPRVPGKWTIRKDREFLESGLFAKPGSSLKLDYSQRPRVPGNWTIRRPRRIQKDNINMCPTEGCENGMCMELVQDRVQWRTFV